MARPCPDATNSRLNVSRGIAVESSIRSGEGCGAGRDEPSGGECSRRLITINYFFGALSDRLYVSQTTNFE